MYMNLSYMISHQLIRNNIESNLPFHSYLWLNVLKSELLLIVCFLLLVDPNDVNMKQPCE